MLSKASSIFNKLRRLWAPIVKQTVAEWADEYRRIPPESASQPGKWRSSKSPHIIEIMNAYLDPTCDTIVCMFSSQMAKSEALINMIFYAIDRRPGPMLMIQPSTLTAKAFMRDRINPSIRDTVAIRDKVAPDRKGKSTLQRKSFPGGQLTIIGANSAAELASRPIRDIFGDEIDRWPLSIGKTGQIEGDPYDVVSKRTTTFCDRKHVIVSTPTVKNLSRIEKMFLAGTQEEFEIPCPLCGAMQALVWENVIYDTNFPEGAKYKCAHCGELFNDTEKRKMLDHHRWVPKFPGRRIRSFHIGELASPWRTLGEIAAAYKLAEAKGEDSLRVFQNTVLGLPFEPKEMLKLTENELRKHEYEYTRLPMQVAYITAAVDVQGNRLEVMFMAHSPFKERWILPIIRGDGQAVAPYVVMGHYQSDATWIELDKILFRQWEHECGKLLRPSVVFIDSSDGNSYEYVCRYVAARAQNRVFAIKGVGSPMAPPLSPMKLAGNNRVPTYNLGVNAIKTSVRDALVKNSLPGPGYIHIPKNLPDSFYRQITSERTVRKVVQGNLYSVWEPIIRGTPNEAWDLLVYNDAARLLIKTEDAIKLLDGLQKG